MQLGTFWDSLAQDLVAAFRHYRGHLATLEVDTKADNTLLTEADVAVERLIVDKIRNLDRDSVIVAEEDGRTTQRADVLSTPEFVWVIDPIDGTAEFVRPGHVEFCSVVCLLRHYTPIAAFVIAPELGKDRQPIKIVADRMSRELLINDQPAEPSLTGRPKFASVTRSAGAPAPTFDEKLTAAGYRLKTRTTSQTLDMVRTALDIDRFTEGDYHQFSLFHRARQKVWDGLAGLCLGETAGLLAVDANGHNRLPVDIETLSQPEPTFDATTMGSPEEVNWFLGVT